MLNTIGILFISVLTTLSGDAASKSAQGLYRQAKLAIESDQPQQALSLLRNLVEQHSETEYAGPAVIPLTELELSSGNIHSAVQLLIQWIPRLAADRTDLQQPPGGIDQKKSDSNFPARDVGQEFQRMLKLLVTALSKLPESELDAFLATVPANNRIALGHCDEAIVRECARRAFQNNDIQRAKQLFERLGDNATSHEKELCDFLIPLSILRNSPSLEKIQEVRDGLCGFQSLPIGQSVSLRLGIAESYRKLGDRHSSLEVLDSLEAELATVSLDAGTERGSRDSVGNPYSIADMNNWRAAVALRQAELQIAGGQRQQAVGLLESAIQQYPQFSLRHELRFLLARCWIAEIEFDRAAAELQQVLSDNQQATECSARALWLLGEIEFLKRSYDSAISYYSQVSMMDQHPQWQARSCLQMGKCRELQSHPLKAIELYQKVVDSFPESDVSQYAAQRLVILQESVPNVLGRAPPGKSSKNVRKDGANPLR